MAGLPAVPAAPLDVDAAGVADERLAPHRDALLERLFGLEQRRDVDPVVDAQELREVERRQQREAALGPGDEGVDVGLITVARGPALLELDRQQPHRIGEGIVVLEASKLRRLGAQPRLESARFGLVAHVQARRLPPAVPVAAAARRLKRRAPAPCRSGGRCS
ncbi:MAG: hypothetical protein ACLFU0_08210 [Alphaproteobacteria bacterium]